MGGYEPPKPPKSYYIPPMPRKASLIGHPDELRVVQWLIDGLPQREIADRLSISRDAIRAYIGTSEYKVHRARLERKDATGEQIRELVTEQALPSPRAKDWPENNLSRARPVDHMELMNEWGQLCLATVRQARMLDDPEAREPLVKEGYVTAKVYWELRKMVGTGVIELESGEIDPVVDRQAALTVAQERHREKWYGKG